MTSCYEPDIKSNSHQGDRQGIVAMVKSTWHHGGAERGEILNELIYRYRNEKDCRDGHHCHAM